MREKAFWELVYESDNKLTHNASVLVQQRFTVHKDSNADIDHNANTWCKVKIILIDFTMPADDEG